ncbi:MAG: hypothetical protein MR924_10830 [Prevotella sp.]|nr:hypothetical protein [Prevotella sp.]
MNCTQQFVSKILKGNENLSLDIIQTGRCTRYEFVE